jgi:hypothetical protein
MCDEKSMVDSDWLCHNVTHKYIPTEKGFKNANKNSKYEAQLTVIYP